MKNRVYLLGKSYYPIIGCLFLGEFGRAMYFIVISWMLYQMTNDPLYTGILIGTGFIPGMILNLFIGVIVDRLNRKYLSVIALLTSTITMTVLLVTILTNVIHPVIILIAHAILQLMGSLFRPSIQALTAETFPTKLLPRIFSNSSAAGISGSLIGATMGGLIIGVTTAITPMFIVVCSYFLGSLLLGMISSKQPITPSTKHSVLFELADGFLYLKSNPFLFNLFGIMFVGQLVFHTSMGFLSIYTIDFLHKTSLTYGLLDATLSIGGIIAGLFGTWWWKINHDRLSTNALCIVCFGLLFVGLAPFSTFAFLGVLLIGLGTTWIRILLQSAQQIVTKKTYHGRMASYRMLCNQGSVVISGPIIGWFASHYGVQYVYLLLLIPVLFAIVLSLKSSFKLQFTQIEKEIS
ncbi:MFS transporter [Aquibacillus rhizosphaerae]|uniref:MFS transporter n=1 Tax=Aquibacillus rhizosphaerae TaxID=3051431 RepID=A0ABT7L5D9_9BACI|nr:MFS transporter [Aquibacillus sp. LR5S19]MDL4841074.1 MFS transporter [Aquibacillus sp. LR5S19]